MRRSPSAADFAAQRADMVEWQLRRRGIRDQSVLNAMAAVPRELFVPERYRKRAYADSALPIGHGQTISQPWIVAVFRPRLSWSMKAGEKKLSANRPPVMANRSLT